MAMSDRRQPRDRRRARAIVQLTPRDNALVRAVARFRAVRSKDLARLFFCDVSRERASQRLRRLFDAGYLSVRFGRLSEPNVYGLGDAGRHWAHDQGLDPAPMPNGDLSHHLALVSLWSRLAARLSRDAHVRLTSFRPDWEVRRSLGQVLPVIPDALVELSAVGREPRVRRFALEVDLGSERERIWEQKLLGYAALHTDSPALLGWENFGLAVVLIGAGDRRRRTVAELVGSLWPADHLVLSPEEWPDRLIALTLPAGSSSSKNSCSQASLTPALTPALEEEGL